MCFEIPHRKRCALGVFASSDLRGFGFAQDDTLSVYMCDYCWFFNFKRPDKLKFDALLYLFSFCKNFVLATERSVVGLHFSFSKEK